MWNSSCFPKLPFIFYWALKTTHVQFRIPQQVSGCCLFVHCKVIVKQWTNDTSEKLNVSPFCHILLWKVQKESEKGLDIENTQWIVSVRRLFSTSAVVHLWGLSCVTTESLLSGTWYYVCFVFSLQHVTSRFVSLYSKMTLTSTKWSQWTLAANNKLQHKAEKSQGSISLYVMYWFLQNTHPTRCISILSHNHCLHRLCI